MAKVLTKKRNTDQKKTCFFYTKKAVKQVAEFS